MQSRNVYAYVYSLSYYYSAGYFGVCETVYPQPSLC